MTFYVSMFVNPKTKTNGKDNKFSPLAKEVSKPDREFITLPSGTVLDK
ncbi:hypothetical protein ACNQF7_14865 [Flavobacterium sp. RSP29]